MFDGVRLFCPDHPTHDLDKSVGTERGFAMTCTAPVPGPTGTACMRAASWPTSRDMVKELGLHSEKFPIETFDGAGRPGHSSALDGLQPVVARCAWRQVVCSRGIQVEEDRKPVFRPEEHARNLRSFVPSSAGNTRFHHLAYDSIQRKFPLGVSAPKCSVSTRTRSSPGTIINISNRLSIKCSA